MEIVSAIDWPAWVFPLVALWGLLYLFRLDRGPGTFKIVQLISSPDGQANSASLGWVVALVLGSWVVWYETLEPGPVPEWMFVGYVVTLIAGGAYRLQTASKERVAMLGQAPVKTEQTTTITNTVTDDLSDYSTRGEP